MGSKCPNAGESGNPSALTVFLCLSSVQPNPSFALMKSTNSSLLMNFSYECVPFDTRPNRSSAVAIVKNQASGVLEMVERRR